MQYELGHYADYTLHILNTCLHCGFAKVIRKTNSIALKVMLQRIEHSLETIHFTNYWRTTLKFSYCCCCPFQQRSWPCWASRNSRPKNQWIFFRSNVLVLTSVLPLMLSAVLCKPDLWLCRKDEPVEMGEKKKRKEKKTNVGLHHRACRVHGTFHLLTSLLDKTFLRVGLWGRGKYVVERNIYI